MNKFLLNINGKEVTGFPGQTILEVAKENDIFIPTLCYDERTRIYGSCGLCMCEVEGNPKLCKACATEIAPGMVVNTQTERVIESRKTNLELLLSNHTGDCRPPCVIACPGHTDCQGYVGLIANGEYEALVAAFMPADGNIKIPASETGSGEKVILGTNAAFPPFEYVEGKNIVGFDITMGEKIAKTAGMKLEVMDMAFDSLIPALQAGTIDFIAAGMSVTEERKKNVDFSVPYFASEQVIIVRK